MATQEQMPKALLWDMDGTLIDTEPYWIESETELVESYGKRWSHEQGLQLVGNALPVSGAIIREQTGIPLTADEIVDALLDRVIAKLTVHVPWRGGAADLLQDAREQGIPCALVTMSYASFAQVLIDVLPADTFDVVVTGDMVTRGKPDPEPYARAAQEIGVSPQECLAFEDSATGVRSAVAAGVPTVAIPHIVRVPDLPGLITVKSLADVRLRDLPTLWQRAAASRSDR